ncbi:TetR/AcrR family transcriptional regulator [Burkholderia cenocepacia]|uniref:TetR/AcrR family transcriptional regulator n=1 Tax=Burkholderia cenocepacia TaxID=95486 RepID=UPI00285E1B0B|nr:TetR/AcrR family transcriptional regulator [Burkholderia cenocepacia]MDR5644432.1 TetR/AcrR family transcriptional regulator [Burkholderia cenocepacia]
MGIPQQSTDKYSAKYLRVLQEAARQFSLRGYHVATTKDIAEALGVQQGSLYYYIRSKEAALQEICQYAIQGYVSFSSQIRRCRQPATEKVTDLVRRHLATLDERPEFFKVFLAHRNDLGEGARHLIGQQIREYESNIVSILRSGVRSGEFRKDLDCELAMLGMLGMCNSVATWRGKRSDASAADIASRFTDLLLRGLAVRHDAG